MRGSLVADAVLGAEDDLLQQTISFRNGGLQASDFQTGGLWTTGYQAEGTAGLQAASSEVDGLQNTSLETTGIHITSLETSGLQANRLETPGPQSVDLETAIPETDGSVTLKAPTQENAGPKTTIPPQGGFMTGPQGHKGKKRQRSEVYFLT
ncbi:hypothetical protein AOLI_G00055270 [Acnodon oligacanthus]